MPSNFSDTAGSPDSKREALPRPYPVVRYDQPGHRTTVVVPLPPPAARRGLGPIAMSALFGLGIVATITAYTTIERLQTYTSELRLARHQLRAARSELARRREEMSGLAERLANVATMTTALRDRAVLVRRSVDMEQSREAPSMLTDLPILPSGNVVESPSAIHAYQNLALLEATATEAVESVGLLAVVLRTQERAHEEPAKAVLWPVQGRVTSEFGTRSDPFNGDARSHAGLDIAGQLGDPVMASADGIVSFTGRDAGYGNLVVVDHGGTLQTFYGHLSGIYVREGQRIRGGLVIGAVGSTGRSTGNHCHFEVRVGGKAINPRRFLANDPDLVHAVTRVATPAKPEVAAAPRKARLLRVGSEAIDRTRRADASAFVGP
jgi:Peptidase family M23